MTAETSLPYAASLKDKTMFVVLITAVALVARGFDWVRATAWRKRLHARGTSSCSCAVHEEELFSNGLRSDGD